MIAGTEEQGVETPEETEFYHKMMDKSSQRLKAMRGKYKGEDCFLIGTGPSLNDTNLNLIRDKNIFGVNELYLGFEGFGLPTPQFYGLSDGDGFDHYGTDVLTLDSQVFLTRSCEIKYLRNYDIYHKLVKKEPILLRSLLPEMVPPDGRPYEEGSNMFSIDPTKGIYSGWTVIMDIGLQVCYYLGFSRVILLGCDMDFLKRDHFYEPSHHEPLEDPLKCLGAKWSHCYNICKEAWEEDGREIINATVGGKLEVFKREKLEELV
jgi:hypothetical protein